MAHDGQELEGPNGYRLRIVRITDELLEMDACYGGDGPARIKWEVRPALRTAEFFEGLYGGAAQADPGAFLARYADEFQLASPPADDSAESA